MLCSTKSEGYRSAYVAHEIIPFRLTQSMVMNAWVDCSNSSTAAAARQHLTSMDRKTKHLRFEIHRDSLTSAYWKVERYCGEEEVQAETSASRHSRLAPLFGSGLTPKFTDESRRFQAL